jgi:hypothetical protein
MEVTIQIEDEIATISLGKWSSEDPAFAYVLSIFSPRVLHEIYTPWPDYTLAEMACKALGGKIIEATDPPEYVEGRIY